MNINEAYKMVYEDIIKSDCGLLIGKFDAHDDTSVNFMFGIQTVMEWIADRASSGVSEEYEEFEKIWIKNFLSSLEKAGKSWE